MTNPARFPPTSSGYLSAKKWLIDNNLWWKYLETCTRDFYSLVKFANDRHAEVEADATATTSEDTAP